jgi:hypothetical protein
MRREQDVDLGQRYSIRNLLHEVSLEITHPHHRWALCHRILQDARDVVRRQAISGVLQCALDVRIRNNSPEHTNARATSLVVVHVHPATLTALVQIEGLKCVLAQLAISLKVGRVAVFGGVVRNAVEVHQAQVIVELDEP